MTPRRRTRSPKTTRSTSSGSPTSSPSSWPPSVGSRALRAEHEGGALSHHPRFINAGNSSAFTLDGTRTYLIGSRDVVVLDPGPESVDHVAALAEAVQGADQVRVTLTHGHRDHAPAAFLLAEELGVGVWGPEGLDGVDRPLRHGDVLPTDEGPLIAVDTPGHARHHLAFHWPERRGLFAGDLVLGRGATTWVGEYPGCVGDYMASLRRLRALEPEVIYPAHGPPIVDPAAAIDRYEQHRMDRIRQVEAVLREAPDADELTVARSVYGDVPTPLHDAVLHSVRALMGHVGYPRT